MQNHHGNTPLHVHPCGLFKLIELLEASDRADVLSIRNFVGDTVLHRLPAEDVLEHIWKLDIPPAHKIFRLQNKKGRSIFHELTTVEVADDESVEEVVESEEAKEADPQEIIENLTQQVETLQDKLLRGLAINRESIHWP